MNCNIGYSFVYRHINLRVHWSESFELPTVAFCLVDTRL